MSRVAETSAAAWLESLPSAHLALLYKHSPICGSSRQAEVEVSDFISAHPEARVYRVDVIGERALSAELAELLGVAHESPQAILLAGRTVVWHGSHGEVTATDLDSAYRAAARDLESEE
jgi:bacillithiol system protein YtxJ